MYEHVDEAGNCVRCNKIDGISEFVQNNQQYAMVKHHLNKYVSTLHVSGLACHNKLSFAHDKTVIGLPNYYTNFNLGINVDIDTSSLHGYTI